MAKLVLPGLGRGGWWSKQSSLTRAALMVGVPAVVLFAVLQSRKPAEGSQLEIPDGFFDSDPYGSFVPPEYHDPIVDGPELTPEPTPAPPPPPIPHPPPTPDPGPGDPVPPPPPHVPADFSSVRRQLQQAITGMPAPAETAFLNRVIAALRSGSNDVGTRRELQTVLTGFAKGQETKFLNEIFIQARDLRTGKDPNPIFNRPNPTHSTQPVPGDGGGAS